MSKPRPLYVRDELSRLGVVRHIQGLSVGNGRSWLVTIAPYRKKRTLSQNALLHKWLGEIAESTGNAIEDVKEAYRGMFLGQRAVLLGEEEFMVGRSTTRLPVDEMSAFMDQIYAHATQELGIMLPHPDELGRDSDGRAT